MRNVILCIMKSTTSFDCSKCSDTGYVGLNPETYDLPENVAWADREFCACDEGESTWQSEQDDKAYEHAERCFTDHGYARGN